MRFTSAKFFAIIFSIIIVASVTVLPTFVHAVGETALEQQALQKSNALDLVGCGGFWNELKISCIVPQLAYYLLYVPAMGLLALSGYVFDFVLSLSIDHKFINQDFVKDLWVIIRNFSNMIFIFVLLYTGVQTIFGLGKWQQTILQVVIVALLVNFSMFFTKVVIDAGNILAVGVYQGMGATKVAGIDRPHKTEAMGKVEERTVSATLVNALSPQQFATLGANNMSAAVTIFIISAIVCAYAAFIFAQASLLFIGRLIAFWFLMAISPFALISMALPKGNIWKWWTDTLINQAFVAPVFLIFIYFIMTAIKGLDNVLKNSNVSESYFDMIVVPIVVTVMIIYALQRALGVAKGMSGKFGGIGADALGKVMSSVAMTTPLGAGAALLRTSVGSRAGKLLESGKLQQMSSNPNSAFSRFAGRTLHGVANKAHTSTFDVRNTDAMKWGVKAMGAKDGFNVKMDLGKGGGKGGYKATLEQIEKDTKAQAEKMKVTDAEKGKDYSVAKENGAENKEILTEATTAHKNAEKQAKETKEWKEYKKLEEDVKTKTSSFKSTEEGLVKQIEDLKKKQAEASYKEEGDIIQEEINKTEENLKQEKDKLENEEKKLTDLENKYKETKEAQFLSEAEIAQTMAKGTYERGQKIIKDTEKWENQENEQRRQYSAENSMNSVFSSTKYYVSEADRTSVIKKVRKGDNKEKKRQEKMWKDIAKAVDTNKDKEEKPEAKETKEEESKS